MQQVIQEVHHDSNLHGTINEQQGNIGQIINEIYRLREELARLKLALRQGFILIDETCAKHSSALEGLQSFAGAEIGASQRIHETLQRLSRQMGILQQKTLDLERNTSLDWRVQAIEDDISKLRLLTPRSEEKVLSTLHLHYIREAKISSLRRKFRNSLLLKMAVLMQNKVKVPR